MSSDDDIAPFEKECQELAETWAEFKLRLPELEKGLPVIRGRPNISTVRIAVEQTAQQWEHKKCKGFARARAGFYQFCGTLDAHSELFNFFPDGDKYISLFSGVISTIVKVRLTVWLASLLANGICRPRQDTKESLKALHELCLS